MDLTALLADAAKSGLTSCLLYRKGHPVLEHYAEGIRPDSPLPINSCTKSVLSALICIAITKGILPSPDTALECFYPELAQAPDPRKRQITLEHLLTMTAGFEWSEFGGINSFPRMVRTANWTAFVLEQPLCEAPGERMIYNSGCSQLLSAILREASGMSVARFAELYLFGPLGILEYQWETDPQGNHTGGFGLKLCPKDMLAFGRLYLDRGMWGKTEVINAGLLDYSVRTLVPGEAHRLGDYGWHWWTASLDGGKRPPVDYYYALGFGGQYVAVAPSLNAVMTATRNQRAKGKPTDLFREVIGPALLHPGDA